VRVAFLIDRWQPRRGGAERALAQFAHHLEERGHEVLAFGVRGPAGDEHPPGRFVRVASRGLGRVARERHLGEALLAAAEAEDCDATVGVRHLPRVDLYWPHGGAHAATLAALGKPCTGRHATFVELERGLLEGGRARAVACVSELVLEELARHYPACVERLHLAPNGVDLERFRPAERDAARARLGALLGWPDAVPRLSFVARHPRPKGIELCFDALAALEERPWRLLIAGPAGRGRWLRMARARGLPRARIAVVERVDSLDLAAGVDLHLAPSRRDPCPLAVLEAVAAGTPALVSEAVGAADGVLSGVGGEVLPLGVATPWSAAISAWLERAEAGESDPEAVRRGVIERGLDDWLAHLEDLLVRSVSAPSCAREPRTGARGS
jgi:glycosyltransferase involved in cell wall biosynthesis